MVAYNTATIVVQVQPLEQPELLPLDQLQEPAQLVPLKVVLLEVDLVRLFEIKNEYLVTCKQKVPVTLSHSLKVDLLHVW